MARVDMLSQEERSVSGRDGRHEVLERLACASILLVSLFVVQVVPACLLESPSSILIRRSWQQHFFFYTAF